LPPRADAARAAARLRQGLGEFTGFRSAAAFPGQKVRRAAQRAAGGPRIQGLRVLWLQNTPFAPRLTRARAALPAASQSDDVFASRVSASTSVKVRGARRQRAAGRFFLFAFGWCRADRKSLTEPRPAPPPSPARRLPACARRPSAPRSCACVPARGCGAIARPRRCLRAAARTHRSPRAAHILISTLSPKR
jgi:hypothetical protein